MAGAKTNNNLRVVVACLVALIQISSSAAATYTVGGTSGWGIPTSDSSLYTKWASQNTFKVDDVLVFNFTTGVHTVAEVSKSNYDACSTSNLISSHPTGPASLTISTAGTHYYICTVSGHCSAGQKLAITATAASSSTPSATSPSSPTTPSVDSAPTSSTTPPPPSSSSSAGAGFVLPLVLVVAAFLL